jgi:hypothetical protein
MIPAAWGLYFGVAAAEDSLDNDASYCELFANFERDAKPTDPYQAPDVLATPYAEDLDAALLLSYTVSLFNKKKTRLFNVSVDWESMFDRTGWTTGVVIYQPMDIPVHGRSKIKFSRLLQLISGPHEPKFIHGHMKLLCDEVEKLLHTGRKSLDGFHRRSVLFAFDGDTPARGKIFLLRSHNAYTFCWRCAFVATSVTAQSKKDASKQSSTLRWLGYCDCVPQLQPSDKKRTEGACYIRVFCVYIMYICVVYVCDVYIAIYVYNLVSHSLSYSRGVCVQYNMTVRCV